MTSILGKGLRYETAIRRRDGGIERSIEFNKLPQEAVDFVAGLLRGTEAPVSTWYVGLFEGNYVPDDDVTAATVASLATECTAYSEGSRPVWNHAYDGSAVVDSLASLATFTLTSAKRIYGAFIVSAATKGGTSGRLLSIARFDTPKDIAAGETFEVGAGLTLIPTSL